MSLTTVIRSQLSKIKAVDFKENDLIDVVDKDGCLLYTINISFGPYSVPMKTFVTDKNFNILGCTPGTRGGWPYYIADFIHAKKTL